MPTLRPENGCGGRCPPEDLHALPGRGTRALSHLSPRPRPDGHHPQGRTDTLTREGRAGQDHLVRRNSGPGELRTGRATAPPKPTTKRRLNQQPRPRDPKTPRKTIPLEHQPWRRATTPEKPTQPPEYGIKQPGNSTLPGLSSQTVSGRPPYRPARDKQMDLHWQPPISHTPDTPGRRRPGVFSFPTRARRKESKVGSRLTAGYPALGIR